MSNSILTKKESGNLTYMISFLRNRGVNALCDRVERVKKNADLGLLRRVDFFTSVVRDAAFRAITLACREKNGYLVRDFSLFLLPDGELSLLNVEFLGSNHE